MQPILLHVAEQKIAIKISASERYYSLQLLTVRLGDFFESAI